MMTVRACASQIRALLLPSTTPTRSETRCAQAPTHRNARSPAMLASLRLVLLCAMLLEHSVEVAVKRTSVQQASPSPTPTETMTIRALDTLETHASSYVTTAARCPARTRAGLTGRSLEGRVWWLTAAQASMVSMLMRLHHARVTLALEETAVSRHATKAIVPRATTLPSRSRVVLMVNGVET